MPDNLAECHDCARCREAGQPTGPAALPGAGSVWLVKSLRLDVFGHIYITSELVLGWTPIEKNTRLMGLEGGLLANRLRALINKATPDESGAGRSGQTA